MDGLGNDVVVEAGDGAGLTVKWTAEDWKGITDAAKRLSEREHGDFTKTDIVRMGTRRFVAEVLAGSEAPA